MASSAREVSVGRGLGKRKAAGAGHDPAVNERDVSGVEVELVGDGVAQLDAGGVNAGR